MSRNPLVGSERAPLPGARSIGKADPAERPEVTLVLGHRQHDDLQERVRKIAAGDKSERHLTHDEYAQQFGADTNDFQAFRQFASQYGLAVIEEHQGRRSVVLAASVDHGRNRPTGSATGPDGEVMLDIEVAGAIAPGAKIVVYFAPNTDAGFLDAITAAIHDTSGPGKVKTRWK